MMEDFIPTERYSARELTNQAYGGIFDQLIALVDGRLEHLSMWHDEAMQELIAEDGLTEDDAYTQALEDITYNIWVAYEGAKHIAIFKGVAPKGAFDVFTTYTCLTNERSE